MLSSAYIYFYLIATSASVFLKDYSLNLNWVNLPLLSYNYFSNSVILLYCYFFSLYKFLLVPSAHYTLLVNCRMVDSRVSLLLRRLVISEGDLLLIFSSLFSIYSFL